MLGEKVESEGRRAKGAEFDVGEGGAAVAERDVAECWLRGLERRALTYTHIRQRFILILLREIREIKTIVMCVY